MEVSGYLCLMILLLVASIAITTLSACQVSENSDMEYSECSSIYFCRIPLVSAVFGSCYYLQFWVL